MLFMINFFRKIRQQLLGENKWSKYLLYATGEIVLVVIGILIALQVNNWNERNKIVVLEHEILLLFKEELKLNLVNFDDAQKWNRIILTKGNDYLNNPDAFDSQDITYSLTSLFNYYSVDINHYILNKVLEESDEKIVAYKFLLKDLRQLGQTYNQMDKTLYYLDEFWNTNTAGFLIKTGLGKNMDSKSKELNLEYKPDNLFDNTLSMQLILLRDYIQKTEQAETLSQSLFEKIEKLLPQ